jgi:hypothetical protein
LIIVTTSENVLFDSSIFAAMIFVIAYVVGLI